MSEYLAHEDAGRKALERNILKHRAMLLARPTEKPFTPPGKQYVVFELAKEKFACDIAFSDEVIVVKSILTIPCTPQYIVGVLSLRGSLVTVIDLRYFFNMQEKTVLGSDRALVIKNGDFRVALLTDDVVGLQYIAHDEIQSNHSILYSFPKEHVSGINNERTIILNPPSLFKREILEVNQ